MTSSPPPLPTSTPAYEALEEEFLRFTQGLDYINKTRLSYQQRREYRLFLENPSRKPVSQREYNIRHRARSKYILIGTQLYRKPRDELDNLDDQATSQPRYIIIVEAAYSVIRRTHKLISPYTGINKTWAEVQRQYYGLNKPKIAWVIRNYKVYQANTSSNVQAPIQMIISSYINKR